MAEVDTSAANVANNALQALPFGQIIGGPLKACIDAQTEAALSTWNYINNVGIQKNEDDVPTAVYVKFCYRSNGRYCSLSIPLLTLVPIPYIAIKDIDIAFKANISAASSVAETKSESLSVGFGMKTKAGFHMGVASASMEMNVNVSSKKDSTATRDSKYSVEYTMDVAVKAGQEDMPAGMLKVLELLNNSIDTVDTNGELSISASSVSLVDGKASVFVIYKNPDGIYEPKKITAPSGATKEEKGNGAMLTFATAGSYEVTISGNKELKETIEGK